MRTQRMTDNAAIEQERPALKTTARSDNLPHFPIPSFYQKNDLVDTTPLRLDAVIDLQVKGTEIVLYPVAL